ncbi:MAG: type I secretion system permease/ATPase [Cyanobacteriota bacterium ELA615]
MNSLISNLNDFLESVGIFQNLSADEINYLAQKAQIWRYRVGQEILLKARINNNLLVVYQGEVRILGFDPNTQMPLTLSLISRGNPFGIFNYLSGQSSETAIASSENVICLALSYRELDYLKEKSPQFSQNLVNFVSPSELYESLGQAEQIANKSGQNLKYLVTNLIKEDVPTALAPPIDDQERLWLKSNAQRYLGLPKNLLLTNSSTNGFSKEKGISLVDTQDIPYYDKPLEPVETEPEYSIDNKQIEYPFVAGKGVQDAGIACFSMLSQYYGMPFRRDIIKRVIQENLQRQDDLSLSFCGAVAELIGLNVQLINIPSEQITSLEAPFLIRWQDSLALVYEISSRQIVIAVPEIGLLRRKPKDFLESWYAEEAEVLLIQKSKDTPQKKFGLSWFWPAIKKHKIVLIEVFIASFFVQIFGLANPLMIQVIIDKVIVQNSVDTLQVLGVFLLIISIFEAILTTLRTYLFVDTTNRIDMSLGTDIIDHLLRLPLKYFEKRPVGEISTRINELENIRQFLTGTALTVMLDAIFSVLYIIVMLVYSVPLTLVSLSIIPIFILLTIVASPIIYRQLRDKAERNAETQSYLVEVMTGIQTVKAQNIELRSRWQWQQRYARFVSAGFKTVITSTLASSASGFLNKISSLLVLWVGTYMVLKGDLTLGQLIAFRIISGYVTSPILRLAQVWQNFQETSLSLERLADIVDTPQEAEEDRQNIPMPAIRGAVRYENVSFRFKSSSALQLNNVSLEIPAGAFVGIVGQSGAGKSTLTKLLARLYEPEAGRILIDEYDINKVELYSLRRQIGFVPQDTLLFEGTVEENIALTNPDASSEEIIEAAKIAVAHDFILNLPRGYNTRVGERGASLSGGQRQRIAIARTVLQNPRMLILDEATSALDYITEQQVYLNLRETFKGRTVLFITHRLSSIKTADIIVMMDQGSVIELGTHQELMEQNRRYYSMYQQQANRV